jgi:gas vesicle protein GvpN
MTSQGSNRPAPAAERSQNHTGPCVWAEAGETFVLTPQLEAIVSRALDYLHAGFPVNLAGPAGTGKTTLALHLAAQLRQPIALIHGDDELGSSDLVGNDRGYRRSKLVDNFIHSVVKTEETLRTVWTDNRLTTACRHGHVLIYDEFTRSRPETNNVLLSVLGARLLNLPRISDRGESCIEVHPKFRAIFTSNPQEYAGVHKSQDALMDRLATIYMNHYDRATEVAITASSAGLPARTAEPIVDVIRYFREHDPTGQRPSIRAAIMIAKVVAHCGANIDPADPTFLSVCRDVLHLGDPCGGWADGIAAEAELHRAIRIACEDRCERAPHGRPAAPYAKEEVLI